MWQDKAVEPQFESRSDYDICKMLAEKMGYGDFFTYDTAGFIDLMLDSDAFRAVGCTPETLREQKTVREFTVDNFVAFENGFATPTGRFSLYWESPMPWYGAGQEIDFAKERTLYWEPSRYADPRASRGAASTPSSRSRSTCARGPIRNGGTRATSRSSTPSPPYASTPKTRRSTG
ncbi:MAG: hypothetical protein V8S24_06235 [Gordonibacter pamelaeae]